MLNCPIIKKFVKSLLYLFWTKILSQRLKLQKNPRQNVRGVAADDASINFVACYCGKPGKECMVRCSALILLQYA